MSESFFWKISKTPLEQLKWYSKCQMIYCWIYCLAKEAVSYSFVLMLFLLFFVVHDWRFNHKFNLNWLYSNYRVFLYLVFCTCRYKWRGAFWWKFRETHVVWVFNDIWTLLPSIILIIIVNLYFFLSLKYYNKTKNILFNLSLWLDFYLLFFCLLFFFI